MSGPNSNLQNCNSSAMHVVLTLPAAPPVLRTQNTPQESWTVDREAWEDYNELDWFISQSLEPDMPHNGRSVLLRWLNETIEGNSWTCCVPLDVEGSWCDHGPFRRLDRALAHVRRHLDLKPYPCGGHCGNDGCDQRFHSSEALSAHRRGPDYRSCDLCENPQLRQNMDRHKTTYCTRRPQADEAA